MDFYLTEEQRAVQLQARELAGRFGDKHLRRCDAAVYTMTLYRRTIHVEETLATLRPVKAPRLYRLELSPGAPPEELSSDSASSIVAPLRKRGILEGGIRLVLL